MGTRKNWSKVSAKVSAKSKNGAKSAYFWPKTFCKKFLRNFFFEKIWNAAPVWKNLIEYRDTAQKWWKIAETFGDPKFLQKLSATKVSAKISKSDRVPRSCPKWGKIAEIKSFCKFFFFQKVSAKIFCQKVSAKSFCKKFLQKVSAKKILRKKHKCRADVKNRIEYREAAQIWGKIAETFGSQNFLQKFSEKRFCKKFVQKDSAKKNFLRKVCAKKRFCKKNRTQRFVQKTPENRPNSGDFEEQWPGWSRGLGQKCCFVDYVELPRSNRTVQAVRPQTTSARASAVRYKKALNTHCRQLSTYQRLSW